jgi:dTDP-4-dehydrorhamnose 3,5-epimerase
MKINLSDEHKAALYFQEYKAQPQIDGVFHQPLKKHRAMEGYFMEYIRVTDGKVEGLPVDFEARQVSLSKAVPGRINAFHLHPKCVQDEIWMVADGTMRVWLVDVRAQSPTFGAKRQFVLSGEQPAMLYIPTGVAHGYQAGADGALLVYAMNSQFNIEDPNEGRLPWDYFGADIWEADRG